MKHSTGGGVSETTNPSSSKIEVEESTPATPLVQPTKPPITQPPSTAGTTQPKSTPETSTKTVDEIPKTTVTTQPKSTPETSTKTVNEIPKTTVQTQPKSTPEIPTKTANENRTTAGTPQPKSAPDTPTEKITEAQTTPDRETTTKSQPTPPVTSEPIIKTELPTQPPRTTAENIVTSPEKTDKDSEISTTPSTVTGTQEPSHSGVSTRKIPTESNLASGQTTISSSTKPKVGYWTFVFHLIRIHELICS